MVDSSDDIPGTYPVGDSQQGSQYEGERPWARLISLNENQKIDLRDATVSIGRKSSCTVVLQGENGKKGKNVHL